MDKLIDILKRIENDEVEYSVEVGEDEDLYVTCDEAEDLIYELLIDKGQTNMRNVYILREAGFRVYAGDSDSFGWLVGCIDTSKGTIVYG